MICLSLNRKYKIVHLERTQRNHDGPRAQARESYKPQFQDAGEKPKPWKFLQYFFLKCSPTLQTTAFLTQLVDPRCNLLCDQGSICTGLGRPQTALPEKPPLASICLIPEKQNKYIKHISGIKLSISSQIYEEKKQNGVLKWAGQSIYFSLMLLKALGEKEIHQLDVNCYLSLFSDLFAKVYICCIQQPIRQIFTE